MDPDLRQKLSGYLASVITHAKPLRTQSQKHQTTVTKFHITFKKVLGNYFLPLSFTNYFGIRDFMHVIYKKFSWLFLRLCVSQTKSDIQFIMDN
jgi:hypothetical protein